MEQAERHRWSFWDALIVTTAQKAQAPVLWTEDLNPGQRVKDVVIRNPFLPTECNDRTRDISVCPARWGWGPFI